MCMPFVDVVFSVLFLSFSGLPGAALGLPSALRKVESMYIVQA